MSLRLRPYCPETDLEPCMAIWEDASKQAHSFLGMTAIEADRGIVRAHYMPQAEIIVAEDGRQILGFIALLGDFVGGLFVAPEAQGRRVGRALIDDARARKGALTVEVYEANESACGFYESCGFQTIATRPEDDQGRPFTLLRMALRDDPRHDQ